MGSYSTIPTVDLSPFTTSSSLAARQVAAKQLAQACHSNGCVGIVGHGLSHGLLQQGFEAAKKLFGLPMEQKMKAPHPKGAVPHRGYSAPGMEKAYTKEDLQKDEGHRDALRKIVDCKVRGLQSSSQGFTLTLTMAQETFEVGSEENKVQYNIWLPEDIMPGFRTFATACYWDLHKISMHILDAMIMALGLSEKEGQYVRSLHSGHENQLRFAHYPPVPVEKLDKEVLSRLPAHTDWSTFTLLFQDSAGGLEFEDRGGEGSNFMPATPDGDKLYLNVGDMLMRLSNDYFPSATHRVTIPKGLKPGKDQMTSARYSIPYFVLPDDDAVIFPQESCIQAGDKAHYKRTTLVEYAEHMAKWQYEES
ncbi:MAG: hypothetical protein Q9217_000513 [Psora testacea]